MNWAEYSHPMTDTPDAERTVMRRLVFPHLVNGQVTEHDLIICTEEEWEASPESRSLAWSVHRDGGEVLALAPVLPGLDLARPQSLDGGAVPLARRVNPLARRPDHR